jgi:hypothetical protein
VAAARAARQDFELRATALSTRHRSALPLAKPLTKMKLRIIIIIAPRIVLEMARNPTMNRRKITILDAALLIGAILPFLAVGRSAADNGGTSIRFSDHHFVPQTLTVPAGKPLIIRVVNASSETIEFESFKLNREVAMTPGEAISVHLPALSPGSYDFYDDFHQDVPEGAIVAK